MDKQLAIRRVRITASVFFSVIAIATCVLWARSYWYVEQVLCTIDQNYIFISSAPGAFGFSILAEESVEPWVIYRQPTKEWRASVDSRRLELSWGGFLVRFNNGPVVVAPYWFWLLIPTTLAVMPWLIRMDRFSLRAMLIATTLVAIVLGLGVWLTR